MVRAVRASCQRQNAVRVARVQVCSIKEGIAGNFREGGRVPVERLEEALGVVPAGECQPSRLARLLQPSCVRDTFVLESCLLRPSCSDVILPVAVRHESRRPRSRIDAMPIVGHPRAAAHRTWQSPDRGRSSRCASSRSETRRSHRRAGPSRSPFRSAMITQDYGPTNHMECRTSPRPVLPTTSLR
jgi:hypothetical protein